MEPAWIEFVKWPYEEHTWHLQVTVADGGFGARQEVYADEAHLFEFADALVGFPRSLSDSVSLEIGKRDPKWAHWLLLHAHVVDGVGHAGLVVETSANGIGPHRREAHFVVRCEAASLNTLGSELRKWLSSADTACRVELKNG